MREPEIKGNGDKAEIFGSFFLGGSEFAIEVAFVQEVVNAPAKYTSVPLAPSYLKGLFNLRGTVVPVLDLGQLLHLQSPTSNADKQVAIVEVGGACVGLLFDRTGEVFKGMEGEHCDFNRSGDAGVVKGVFKKDSGQRIIQILDVSQLFKLRNVPKESNRSRSERESVGRKRGQRKQCISFVVGPSRCALPISDIQEILKVDKILNTSLGVGHCIGAIDLRGATVPLIDFAALLNYRPIDRSLTSTQGDQRIVVMRLEEAFFGLVVDAVDSIVSFYPDEVLTFPTIEQERSALFLGCLAGYGDNDILLLNRQEILTNEEIRAITHGHSRLYQQASGADKNPKSKGGVRRTYITFRIDGAYAVDIGHVKEIIEFPKQLLKPPGMKPHMRGVLNLRGELITIVDTRSLYSGRSQDDTRVSQKVLIFNKNSAHFGLVVDSVDALVTFSENDKIKLPQLLYGVTDGNMAVDLTEAVEVTDAAGVRTNMLILNVDSVALRVAKTGV